MKSSKSLIDTIPSQIYCNSRGYAFSKADFTTLENPGNVECSLGRMAEKGLIRRIMRGLHNYPAGIKKQTK